MWTQTDLDFWAERKAPPTILHALDDRRKGKLFARPMTSIHAVINSHVPRTDRFNFSANNLICLLHSTRRRKECLLERLQFLELNPNCSDAKQRSAFARKWRKMIEKNRQVKDMAERSAIRKTPGVCGGTACIGMTRIAVWTMESYRRRGVSENQLLKLYPSIYPAGLVNAWEYVAAHKAEIDEDIRRNDEI